MRHSLARRYSILSASMTALVGCCVLLVNVYYLERYSVESLESGIQQISNSIEKQMVHDAELMTRTLANNLVKAVYDNDFSSIKNQLEVLRDDAQVLYTYVHNPQGIIIHDGTEELLNYGLPITQHLPLDAGQVRSLSTTRKDQFLHLAAPIQVGTETMATLRIGIAFKTAQQNIESVSSQLESQAVNLRNDILLTSLNIIFLLLLLATVAVFLFSQRLLAPIHQLAERCNRYASGKEDTLFRLDRNDDFGILSDALERMKLSVSESQKQIEQLAYLDPLTHLPNRRMFNEELDSLLKWAKHHSEHVGILFIDLDHFKQVNDVAGHDVGDMLLQQAAGRLTALLEFVADRIDTPIPENLLLSRLGGDEFVMTIPCYKEDRLLSEIAAQIELVMKEPFIIKGTSFTVSASIGITKYPEHADNLTDLIKQADIAMYAAKHSGRKQYRFFEASMNKDFVHKIRTIEGVRLALAQNHFHLEYQPIVDLRNDQVIGAEALLRWDSPERGLILPGNFIPLIEKTDLIVPLTVWVLNQACKDLSEHFLPIDPKFKLSVNISGAAMKDATIHDRVGNILDSFKLPPDRLHLEITETSMMENIEKCSDTLNEWRESGAVIWIDDFGTGYSSLSYLHTLPLDGLKIDRSFVSNPENTHQVIKSIIALAEGLGLETIAEGIETKQQHDYMIEMGSQYGQGYLFSHPVTIDSLLTLLNNAPQYEPQAALSCS